MDVRAGNFEQFLQLFRAALQDHQSGAVYVAIDLEFTGVTAGGQPDSYADTAEERLEKLCRIVECYAPIQMGITICNSARRLSTYSIMVAPESTFLCDISALKFVREHNVDLNVWADEGVRYMSREEEGLHPAYHDACQEDLLEPLVCLRREACGANFLCNAQRLRAERRRGLDLNSWVQAQEDVINDEDAEMFELPVHSGAMPSEELACRKVGLPRLWQLLKEARRPLIVHGFLDVLFLLAAFEQRILPRDPTRLAVLVQECFPSGVFDTAFLHESIQDLRLCPLRLHRFLQSAREHYQRKHGSELQFELEELTAGRYGDELGKEGDELTHEAGYDSLMTAKLFGHLKEAYKPIVAQGANRFYLHKSTDCLNLFNARVGRGAATTVYDSERLVVAILLDQDAIQNTAKRISEARRSDREYAFFYRKMEESLLLIPDCPKVKLEKLSRRLPGVHWIAFHRWQEKARSERERPPDRGSRFSGYIKSFSKQRGFGFIYCPDCSRIYDNDVFLHQLQATGFQEGQQVSFSVVCNDKGQPQARDLEECWFTGVVRTGDAAFLVSCPRTFRMYSRDVILRNGQIDNCQVGDCISFSVVVERTGQPCVKEAKRQACTPRQETRDTSEEELSNDPDEQDRLYSCAECSKAAEFGAIDEQDGLWYCKACWLTWQDQALTRSKFFGG